MIYFLEKEGDEWYSYTHKLGRYLSIPDKFKNLEQIEFLQTKVPSPIEGYLKWCYGDWENKNSTRKSWPPAREF